MTDTLDVLTKISDDFEKNYRSVSAVTDFSKVVVGMMDSLKDLELKGDEMMKKIDVQESQLKSLNQEIEAKEEYINVVNNKVKESEAIFNDLQDKVKKIKSEQKIGKIKGKIIYKAIEVSCLINLHFPSNLNFSFRGMLLNVARS